MKFVDLKLQDKKIRKNILNKINYIVSRNDFINGQINQKVENKFDKKYQLGYSALVSS